MWEESHVRLPLLHVVVEYQDQATGQIMVRTPDALADRFAGYDQERGRIWGSGVIAGLGLWWLPQLARHNLAVPAESLDAFRDECTLALEMAETLAAESGCPETDIRQALRNFLCQASEAQTIGGWVEIS
jgi:hypothetical protein